MSIHSGGTVVRDQYTQLLPQCYSAAMGFTGLIIEHRAGELLHARHGSTSARPTKTFVIPAAVGLRLQQN